MADTDSEKVERAIELHFSEGWSVTEAADQVGIRSRRLIEQIRQSDRAPLCGHCRNSISGLPKAGLLLNLNNGFYCSDACQAAASGEAIECPDCDFTCKTVGRYQSHRDSVHKPVPYWEAVPQPWGQLRQTVLERDGHLCVRCGFSQEDHKEEYGAELHVHHIIKRRFFDDREMANFVENLVSLCSSCHQEVESMTPYEMFCLQPEYGCGHSVGCDA